MVQLVRVGNLSSFAGRVWWAPGAAFAIDFKNGRVHGGGAIGDLIEFSRSSEQSDLMPAAEANAAYTVFAAGVLPLTPGRGVTVEEARSNLCANPTVPASQTITLASTGTYVLWVNGAGSATLAANTATINAGGTASNGNWLTFSCTATGTVDIAVSGPLQAMQLEKGARPTSFMPNQARAAPRFRLGGAARALIASLNAFTVLCKVRGTVATPTFASIINFKSPSLYLYSSGSSIDGNDGNGSAIGLGFSIGTGDSERIWAALSTDTAANRRAIAANGAPPITGSRLLTQSMGSADWLFLSNFSSSQFNGVCEEIQIIPAELRGDALSALCDPRPGAADITMFGDSLTKNGQDGTALTIAGQIAAPHLCIASGQDGNSSTQIKNRLHASPISRGRKAIIFAGTNNLTAPVTVLADIAAMVADLSADFLILSPFNRIDQISGAAYTGLQAILEALADDYPDNFLNVWQMLQDDHDPANACDVVNATPGAGCIPNSFRAVLSRGTLTETIADGAQTAFNVSSTPAVGTELRIGATEWVRVLSATSGRVTNCVRGYAGTAGTHAIGEALEARDPVHLGGATGCAKVADYISTAITGLGW